MQITEPEVREGRWLSHLSQGQSYSEVSSPSKNVHAIVSYTSLEKHLEAFYLCNLFHLAGVSCSLPDKLSSARAVERDRCRKSLGEEEENTSPVSEWDGVCRQEELLCDRGEVSPAGTSLYKV